MKATMFYIETLLFIKDKISFVQCHNFSVFWGEHVKNLPYMLMKRKHHTCYYCGDHSKQCLDKFKTDAIVLSVFVKRLSMKLFYQFTICVIFIRYQAEINFLYCIMFIGIS